MTCTEAFLLCLIIFEAIKTYFKVKARFWLYAHAPANKMSVQKWLQTETEQKVREFATPCGSGRQEAFTYGPSSLPSGCLGYVLWTSQRSQCTVLCRRLGSRSGHSSDVPSVCNDVMFWNDQKCSARTGVSVMDEWFLWTEFCLRLWRVLFFSWVDSVWLSVALILNMSFLCNLKLLNWRFAARTCMHYDLCFATLLYETISS